MTKIPKINIMNIIGTIDLGIKLDLNKIKTETLVRESKKYSGEIISKKVKSIYKNLIK